MTRHDDRWCKILREWCLRTDKHGIRHAVARWANDITIVVWENLDDATTGLDVDRLIPNGSKLGLWLMMLDRQGCEAVLRPQQVK